MTSELFSWRKMKPFGITMDVDLAHPLSHAQSELLCDLLYDNGLIVFRGQALDIARQAEIMAPFGRVLGEDSGTRIVSTDPDKGWGGTGELKFHSDLAFSPHPCRVMSLYGADVVDGETSTLFVSGMSAFERLPGRLKARIENLKARMVFPRLYGDRAVDAGWHVPQTDHPLLMMHPVTGKPLLYLTELQTECLVGADVDEALMRELFGYLYDTAEVYEHHWHSGDLVIWDNIAIQHARSALPQRTRRTLHRVIVADKTFAEMYPDVPEAAKG